MKFLLTTLQARKLHDAITNKKKCTLTLSSSKQSPGGIDLPLSKKQIALLNDNRPHKITFSDKNGGFLPFLAPLIAALPAIAAGGTAVAAATTTAKKIYDWSKGRGVGGIIPLGLLPLIASVITTKMAQSGKGLAESAKNIFLSPQFLSLIDKEIKKQTKGQGLMLGPPRHYPY